MGLRTCVILIYLICITSSGHVLAQKLGWRADLQLKWEDFRAPIDPASPFNANTYNHITYNYAWDADGTITINVTCEFDSEKSWKKPGGLTDALLRHEQLHFNIGEIFARKMRKAFAEYAQSHKASKETATDVQKIFDNLSADYFKYQDAYDKATDHSKNKPQQAEWDKKIASELKELAAYASK